MKQMGITVSRYASAFAGLHAWLRERSALEWPRHRVFMTPGCCWFQIAGEFTIDDFAGFTLNLRPLCARLFSAQQPKNPQMSLPFGLESVR
jgi:hypothetical protein